MGNLVPSEAMYSSSSTNLEHRRTVITVVLKGHPIRGGRVKVMPVLKFVQYLLHMTSYIEWPFLREWGSRHIVENTLCCRQLASHMPTGVIKAANTWNLALTENHPALVTTPWWSQKWSYNAGGFLITTGCLQPVRQEVLWPNNTSLKPRSDDSFFSRPAARLV